MSARQPEEMADFEGVVIELDQTGYGVVQFSKPPKMRSKVGFFTKEVLQNPEVARKCVVDKKVMGRARVVMKSGFRIVNLEPLEWKERRPA